MNERRPIPPGPIPPPPPEYPPPAGTPEWARWHLRHTFSPTDAAVIEFITITSPYNTGKARVEYARACHEMKWAGWQAGLAWNVIEAILAPLDDDIPF